MRDGFVSVLVVFAGFSHAAPSAQQRPPVIDMHMHAWRRGSRGKIRRHVVPAGSNRPPTWSNPNAPRKIMRGSRVTHRTGPRL